MSSNLPLFCVAKNLLTINSGITMKTCWLTVTDHIPIADRREGVVYFIDKYEKNHAYCKKNCKRQRHRKSCFSSGTDETNDSEEDIAAFVSNDVSLYHTIFI